MAEKKPKAVKKPKAPKAEKTEAELVSVYAKKVMNAASSTMVDRKDLHGMLKDGGIEVKKTATMLALDRDFYFSVVFQTADQKYEFLRAFCEKFGVTLETSDDEVVDILNGLRLADSLQIPLKKEPRVDYPDADATLLPYVLDNLE